MIRRYFIAMALAGLLMLASSVLQGAMSKSQAAASSAPAVTENPLPSTTPTMPGSMLIPKLNPAPGAFTLLPPEK